MTAIVYDFQAIAKLVRFRDTPKQDQGTPVIPEPEVDYGMYACFTTPAVLTTADVNAAYLASGAEPWADTAPSEYSPPDFDPA